MAHLGSGDVARFLKSAIDPVVGAVLLMVLSPLLLLIALAIRVDSRGSVFYLQDRVGRNGRVFRLVKFRSMIQGADQVGLGMKVARNDSRITNVGVWLRRFSLDELPQLLNIARGDMSIVGPRPTFPAQVARYTARQRGRLAVKPGLTGWAQVNGRNSLSWAERIEYDLWYVQNWSILLDLRIILKTPMALLASEGVYGKNGITRELEDD